MKMAWGQCHLILSSIAILIFITTDSCRAFQSVVLNQVSDNSKKIVLNSKNNADTDYDQNELIISRRRAIETSGKAVTSLLLASSILASSSVANAGSESPIYADSKRSILLTGCNSGIGFDAAKRMAMRGHEIILACRTLEKAVDASTRIQDELGAACTGKLIPKECNLADLNSIQSLVQDLTTSGTKLDSICLNAGIARNTAAKEVLYTRQGFELTIGTNHLGHFYLTNQLLPMMKTEGAGSNIIVTASGVHDPDSPGGAQGSKATLGDMKGLEKSVKDNVSFDMVDGGSYDPDKAYKDSKVRTIVLIGVKLSSF